MNGIEKIKERILNEAHAYAEACVKKASGEADKILEAARQEAERKKKAMTEEAERESDRRTKRMIARADMEAGKERLRVKQELVGGVMRTAADKLRNLPADRYCEVLARMIITAAGEEKVEVVLSAEDKKRLSGILPPRIEALAPCQGKKPEVVLAEYTEDISGGFILKTGGIEMNYSIEALMRAEREELEEMVYSALGLK